MPADRRPMLLRRCHALLIEPREELGLDLADVFSDQPGLSSQLQWMALAAHCDEPVLLDAAMLQVLGSVSPSQWTPREKLEARHSPAVIGHLLDQGLLVADIAGPDSLVREQHWHSLAAVAQRHLRWRGVDSQRHGHDAQLASGDGPLLDRLGPPPAAGHSRTATERSIPLPAAPATALQTIAARRATCRNFDASRPLPARMLSGMLSGVYAATAVDAVSGVPVLKKNVPSAGGLHPVEAYVLIRNVEEIETGLYHYDAVDHRLEPLRRLAQHEAADLARVFVAHQEWFVDAPVQVILAGRFGRNFWKYRNHAKAWRAVILDAGHLSQMQYLAATELGLAAFITAAINEGEIEDAFGLDPMVEGVLAVTGFGYRGAVMNDLEFDPLHAVWPDPG